jgi:uncharacterized protein (TIGR00725 family)
MNDHFPEPKPRLVIGVMGPGACDARTYALARTLGRLLSEAGYPLLCGGGGGVMEAAARGAREAGGLTIGILPGRDRDDSPPNPWIEVPIFTGLAFARNSVNVLTSQVIVAVGGGPGTLSEISLAIKYGRPVVLLDSWEFSIAGFQEPPNLHRVRTPEEAVAQVERIVARSGAS